MSLGKKFQTKKKEVGKLEHKGSIRERFMALINIIYTYIIKLEFVEDCLENTL